MGQKRRQSSAQRLDGVGLLWCGVIGLAFVVFVALMVAALPHDRAPLPTASMVFSSGGLAREQPTPLAQFSLLAVCALGVVALFVLLERHPRRVVAQKKRRLEQLMRQMALAVRSNNRGQAQEFYGVIHRLYYEVEPHVGHYREAIHRLHRGMSRLR